MSELIGRQIELGISIEGIRGTGETVASKWVKNVSADIMPRVEKVIDDNSQGVLEDSPNSRVVREWFDGDLSGIAHADVVGYAFTNIYGGVTTETVSGAVKDHTFEMEQDIAHPTLSIFAKDGDVYQGVYNGGVVNTFELTATTDNFVRYSTNLIARNQTSNADTVDYDTEYDFIGKDITVKVAATEAGLTGATALKLKELNVSWDTGAITDFMFGSNNPDNVYNSRLAIKGSFTKNYVDDTFKDLFTSDDARYMQIVIAGDAALAGSNRPTITITLNKAQIQEWERAGANDDLVTETVSFKAFYNNADEEQSKVVVRNITSAYTTGS